MWIVYIWGYVLQHELLVLVLFLFVLSPIFNLINIVDIITVLILLLWHSMSMSPPDGISPCEMEKLFLNWIESTECLWPDSTASWT